MEFQRCQYVVGRERTELACQLNLSETQVRGYPGHRTPALAAWELLQCENQQCEEEFRHALKLQVNQRK